MITEADMGKTKHLTHLICESTNQIKSMSSNLGDLQITDLDLIHTFSVLSFVCV